jgi:hypothetical protein
MMLCQDRAVTNRLLVDIDPGGRASVLLAGDLPDRVGDPFELNWPLDEPSLEDLRWYLEDYLRVPYGPLADRGQRIHDDLSGWGHQVFNTLFTSGPARDKLVQLRDSCPRLEIVLRSANAQWLGCRGSCSPTRAARRRWP